MKRILLISAVLLGALSTSQAQLLNKNNTKRIGQAVKKSCQDVKEAIVQDTRPSGEHTLWDIYIAPKVGLNLSNLPGINGNIILPLMWKCSTVGRDPLVSTVI